jgi:hypothetical protein
MFGIDVTGDAETVARGGLDNLTGGGDIVWCDFGLAALRSVRIDVERRGI